ncbi:hypothetical protein [Glaciibacter superstes]|uniref:hypothetical protein n=1 Tax=Glaciibacter superstes TaxID=501023 RepID=UPI0003B4FB39|nr:hypothetical protein [Glaciibacter superstes]
MSTTKGDRPAGVTATEPGAGRVMLHFTMSLDGFIAGPNHETDWMSGFSELPPGAFEAYAEAVGAVSSRPHWRAAPRRARAALPVSSPPFPRLDP